MPDREIVTTSDRPDLDAQGRAALLPGWPEFIFHDPVSSELMGRVAKCFPQYDVRILDNGAVVAGGWGVPLQWNATAGALPAGYDGALIVAVTGHENAVPPDTLCVMAAAVRQDQQGAGLGGQILTVLRSRATASGLERMIAPVRPVLKNRYPLTPMGNFARWTRGDGTHIDPWIRTHQRLGAVILGPAPRSMVVTGTVTEWEEWAGMAFPETGRYVVPRALDLVEIDRERDLGAYAETNLWMRHRELREACGARLLDLAWPDYWIWPGRPAGLASSLSDLLRRLPARALPPRLSDGTGRRGVSKDAGPVQSWRRTPNRRTSGILLTIEARS